MKKRYTCSVKYFCLGAFLIFLGSVLLCGLGLTVVLPHEATRGWREVTCHVINSSFSTRICACEHRAREAFNPGRCLDAYPCLHIDVSYRVLGRRRRPEAAPRRQAQSVGYSKDVELAAAPNASGPAFTEGRQKYALLTSNSHEAESRDETANATVVGSLYRSWEDEFFKTCALHECGTEDWNFNEVHKFERRWGRPGSSFPCYYDPDDVVQAILERTPTSQMIHALFWPTVFLVGGILIWLGLWVGCWEVDMEKYSQPNIDRTRGDLAIGGRILIN